MLNRRSVGLGAVGRRIGSGETHQNVGDLTPCGCYPKEVESDGLCFPRRSFPLRGLHQIVEKSGGINAIISLEYGELCTGGAADVVGATFTRQKATRGGVMLSD